MIATLYLDSSPVARFVAYSLHKVYVQTHVVNCYVLFLFRNNTLNKKHIIRDTSYMIHDTECIMHHTYFIYIYIFNISMCIPIVSYLRTLVRCPQKAAGLFAVKALFWDTTVALHIHLMCNYHTVF